VIGSALIPLLLGVALGDLLVGLPVDSSQEYTGTFWNLLTPYGVFVGVTLLVLSLQHGATFLTLRTLDGLRERAHRYAWVLSWPAFLLVVGYAVWTAVVSDRGFWWGVFPTVLAAVAAFVAGGSVHRRAEGLGFAGTAATIGLVVISLFTNLYPDVLVSSTNPSYSLTVEGTASSHYALQVMTWVAVVLLPVVLAYQAWTYVVFRRRLALPPAGSTEPSPSTQGAPA
jgi:cytochrome d ubiquinol oxidase subunit II